MNKLNVLLKTNGNLSYLHLLATLSILKFKMSCRKRVEAEVEENTSTIQKYRNGEALPTCTCVDTFVDVYSQNVIIISNN